LIFEGPFNVMNYYLRGIWRFQSATASVDFRSNFLDRMTYSSSRRKYTGSVTE
jgi:hypothetical protein